MFGYNKNELSSLGVLGISKKYNQQTSPPSIDCNLQNQLLESAQAPRNLPTETSPQTPEVDVLPKSIAATESPGGDNCKSKQELKEPLIREGVVTEAKPFENLWYLNKTTSLILILHAIYALLFTALVRYSFEADAGEMRNSIHHHLGGYEHEDLLASMQEFAYASMYLFVCLSFHLLRGRRYHFGTYGEFFLVGCMSLEWAILVLGFIKPSQDRKVTISIERMTACIYACVSVLITFSSLVGRASLLQLTTMHVLHVPLQVFTSHILESYLQVNDSGKTLSTHLFGAFYGLAASLALLARKHFESTKKPTQKGHEMLTLVGTVLVVIYWPHICISKFSGDARRRILINTFVALGAATITSFPMSSICNPSRKFCIESIQDGVIGSGVVISSVSALMVEGYGSLLIGSISAAACISAKCFIMTKLERNIGNHDSCDVFVTHGIAGIIGGLLSAIMAGVASPHLGNYGYRLYELYPARSPVEGSEEFKEVQSYLMLPGGKGRSAAVQVLMQFLGILTVLLIASLGGAITGLLLRLRIFKPTDNDTLENCDETENIYNDIERESLWPLREVFQHQ